jgi:hypothetical protein
MNALAMEANVNSSLKKYFVDALGINITFDVSLASPDIRKQGTGAVNQWYNISFGQFGRQVLSEYDFEIFCLSRQDFEGKKLVDMSDVLMSLLLDSTKSDGMRRIPFYDIKTTPWALIGAMVVQEINDTPVFTLSEDETKMKIFSVRLRWGTAI